MGKKNHARHYDALAFTFTIDNCTSRMLPRFKGLVNIGYITLWQSGKVPIYG
jgi:hypothetical protein